MSEIAKKVARLVSQRIVSAIAADDEFWDLVDEEITAELDATEQPPAQIWLGHDGNDLVCVTLFGRDEPLLMPFFVPAPDLPFNPGFKEQVEECRHEIEAIRRFANGLLATADEAQTDLDKMLGKPGASE